MSNPVPPPGGQPVIAPDQLATVEEPPAPQQGGRARKVLLRIALVVVVAVVGILVRSALFGDRAKEAKAGDCIAADKDVSKSKETRTGAKVVDCGSAEAKFSVVARVDGESDTGSASCDKFFRVEEDFFVYGSSASGGYLLCLRPKA